GAGSGTAANIKGSVTRSRDNYLENRRLQANSILSLVIFAKHLSPKCPPCLKPNDNNASSI
ncbi:hypothetical protein, partial [Ectopseudomonas oleovorans]|uniref:hypothetical protein n=1 Tax=Ectopseudomonas oleovorans TaxID=301 RepID=UPI001C8B7192